MRQRKQLSKRASRQGEENNIANKLDDNQFIGLMNLRANLVQNEQEATRHDRKPFTDQPNFRHVVMYGLKNNLTGLHAIAERIGGHAINFTRRFRMKEQLFKGIQLAITDADGSILAIQPFSDDNNTIIHKVIRMHTTGKNLNRASLNNPVLFTEGNSPMLLGFMNSHPGAKDGEDYNFVAGCAQINIGSSHSNVLVLIPSLRQVDQLEREIGVISGKELSRDRIKGTISKHNDPFPHHAASSHMVIWDDEDIIIVSIVTGHGGSDASDVEQRDRLSDSDEKGYSRNVTFFNAAKISRKNGKSTPFIPLVDASCPICKILHLKKSVCAGKLSNEERGWIDMEVLNIRRAASYNALSHRYGKGRQIFN